MSVESIGGGLNSRYKTIIKKFLQSEKHFRAFMAAYHKEAHLWDHKQFPHKLNNEDSLIYLQNMTKEIKCLLDVELDTNLIAHIIETIRTEYKSKMTLFKTPEQEAAAVANKSVPDWYFGALAFLKPHLQHSIQLNCDTQRKHLSREQILQIISIYKQFPQLWNTSLVEYVCLNKRQEAYAKMSQIIHSKMGLKIRENTLQQYLKGMHDHFTKEKIIIHNSTGKKETPNLLYYEHLKFLNGHVEPFFCSFCGVKKKSPL
ncbi:uncharacterized protein [Musca autumnalis]|uniref:uncharacterized protein n=1 Tax=Musca autumnalis TaxID=221902 RepID=UPI003CF8F7ED